MLEFVTGDFFDYEANIRVNTVNCVGVMGAGVALAFKDRYPKMYNDYVHACKHKEVAPGKPHIWVETDLLSSVTIINFPTKIHWKNPSEYEYIEKGLTWLREYLSDKGSSAVTLPALGCGHGGLDWAKVKGMIIDFLGDLEVKIFVFNPKSSTAARGNDNWLHELEKNNILTISPSDEGYPKEILGRSSYSLYCIGNTALLKEKKLSILANSKSSEKEINSLTKVINEMPIQSAVLLLSLKNNNDYEFADMVITKGFCVIFVIPYGILKFDVQNRYRKNWDMNKFLVVSTTVPDQSWKIYENSNSLRFRQKLADVTLINSLDLKAIESLSKYVKGPTKKNYYINYWLNENETLRNLNAIKIGNNNQTGKINLAPLLESLIPGKYLLE
ncbi:macro domain-containing protein [Paenibacillus sp. GCM10012306]|uniref:macro domain-containing protein n=1 Tax=Paenibacillus sp. GCM10012306 TaxID=3317342 RepID=UPI0036240EF2